MNIGIIDADLIGRKRHRFPNLACMKLSSFHKRGGDSVTLLQSYVEIPAYDRVYVSKVFTDTDSPAGLEDIPNVLIGGTGFFYDKAEPLPREIEHCMPDYGLYSWFVETMPKRDRKFYTDYSIGFTTRGCFRRCQFCVNRNYSRVELHSPISEFLDDGLPKICLLDDNVLGSPRWRDIFDELRDIGKPFQFKQGLDERMLDDDRCRALFSARYDGPITFAFDDVADSDLIERKLKLIRTHTDKELRFYVLVGFDRSGRYDAGFWDTDIRDAFNRIDLLRQYRCLPYIMRFERYAESPFRGMYVALARWCNQPSLFKKKSFREFCHMDGNPESARYLDWWLAEQRTTDTEAIDRKW